ncbi:MAG: hypothetical protein HY759_03495 [Nitrospirae bacterium]|nr:hypothetical protein [Nitrospirota bacterium]
MLINACASVTQPVKNDAGEFYFKGVPLNPGAAAWSKDSARLAVIKDRSLIVIDTESGKAEEIKGVVPVFIDWSPGDDLLAVSNEQDGNKFLRINVSTGRHETITVKHPPASVRWFIPPDKMLALSFDRSNREIGTFVTYRLSMITSGDEKEFFKGEVYYNTLRRDIDITTSWTHPGIRPIEETALTPKFHRPPLLAPYTYFRTVDPVTSLETDILKFESRRFSVPSSWSPDGSRLAVSNDEGLLTIINVDNQEDRKTVNYDIHGFAPAWNPMGNHIYMGGWLINPDGRAWTQLLPAASNSVGIWSPDGKKLVVITDENVLYLKKIAPSIISAGRQPDSSLLKVREKLRILKDLYSDGLISLEEFYDKKSKIINVPETGSQ